MYRKCNRVTLVMVEEAEEVEEVAEDLVDVEAARGHVVLQTTPAFLVISRTSTATPTGDAIKILLIVRGKLMDVTTQQ